MPFPGVSEPVAPGRPTSSTDDGSGLTPASWPKVLPAAGSTFGHVHGAEIGYEPAADPSSVDEVGRPGVPHNHGEGTLNR